MTRRWKLSAGEDIVDVIARACADGLGLREVAAEVGVSPRTLQRALEADGTSFSEIRESVRWYQAAIALVDRVSVRSAAGLAGFATASHFCSAFKAVFGVSPGSFRDAARHEALSWRMIERSNRRSNHDNDADLGDFGPLVDAHLEAAAIIASQMTSRGRDIYSELTEL